MFEFLNKNNTKKFDMKKLENLAALANVAAESVTQEQLNAANAELVEAGISAAELVPTGSLTAATEQLNAVQAQLDAANTALADAQAQVTTANETIEQLQAENASLKPAPGAAAAHPGEDGEDLETAEDTEKLTAEEAEKQSIEMGNAILEKHGMK